MVQLSGEEDYVNRTTIAAFSRYLPAVWLVMAGSCLAQQVVATIPTGGLNPSAVAVNKVTNTVYVANLSSSNVVAIDGSANTIIATIPAGADPAAIAVNEITNQIYVLNEASNSVTVIDGTTKHGNRHSAGGEHSHGDRAEPNHQQGLSDKPRQRIHERDRWDNQ